MTRVNAVVSILVAVLCACDEAPVGVPQPLPASRGPVRLVGAQTANATVTYLGTYPGSGGGWARGVNGLGQAVGLQSGGTAGSSLGVFFGAAVTPIGELPTGATYVFSANAINDAGTITGQGPVVGGYVAQIGGLAAHLPDVGGPIGSWVGTDISNSGDVAGYSQAVGICSAGFSCARATLWRRSGSGYTPIDIGFLNGLSTLATSITPNLSGSDAIVVGYSDFVTECWHAFMWKNGVMTGLTPLPENEFNCTVANGVADNGMIVGFGSGPTTVAMLWDNGVPRSLGSGTAYGIALTSGTPRRVLIVGEGPTGPTVWYDNADGGFDAQALPLLTGDTGGTAYDVNASGQIVGLTAASTGDSHAVLWTFTPPPLTTNRPPTAAIGGPYAGNEGASVAFNGSTSSDPDGQTLTFDWDFGDDAAHGTGATPSHTYADNASYTVTLTVSDGAGGSNATSTTASIGNATPQVNAGAASAIQSGQTLAFSGSFADAGTADGPWSWTIAWGDGSISTSGTAAAQGTVSASHTFYDVASFTVQLSVTDKDGATATSSRTVTVSPRSVTLSVLPDPVSLSAKNIKSIDVVIFSATDLDATKIDPATVRIGNGIDPDAMILQRKNGSFTLTLRDVNRDGLKDLQVTVDKADPNLGLAAPSTTLVLRAAIPAGTKLIALRGTVEVDVSP